jgi:hypothetical protein
MIQDTVNALNINIYRFDNATSDKNAVHTVASTLINIRYTSNHYL